jgi:hypothetical protein
MPQENLWVFTLVIRDSRRLSLEDMIRIADARPNLVFFEGM